MIRGPQDRSFSALAFCGIVLAGLLVTEPCDAGNRGSAFLSNQAAMMGEAVVALIDDAGAAWYNPAGLASLDHSSLDLSASAFLLRHYRIPSAAKTRFGDGPPITEGATFTEVVSVPSALTYVRSLSPDLTGAIGVFVPDAEDLEVTADFDSGAASPSSYRWNLTATRRTSTYLAGPALGWRPAAGIRIGASSFLGYEANRSSRVFQATSQSTDATGISGSVHSLERASRTHRFGWVTSIGVQVDPGAGWRMGATLRSPRWVLGVLDQTREITHGASVQGSGTPQALGESVTTEHRSSTFQASQPVRFTLGVAKNLGDAWVSVEGDVEPALTNEKLGVRQNPLWNLRAGARHPLSRVLSLGAGVFTDRSPDADPSSLGELQINYYGASMGAQISSAYGLRDDPGRVAFSTTIALRYALGKGHVGGLIFDPSAMPQAHEAAVTVHELGLHVGSAVEF